MKNQLIIPGLLKNLKESSLDTHYRKFALRQAIDERHGLLLCLCLNGELYDREYVKNIAVLIGHVAIDSHIFLKKSITFLN